MITKDDQDLFKLNMEPLIASIDQQFSQWPKLRLSWFARMAKIKMIILPKTFVWFQNAYSAKEIETDPIFIK